MRILKLSAFSRWAKTERITDKQIKNATDEVAQGLVDARLGNGLYKKRIARPGQGKRSGYRTILAFKDKHCVIFLFGFAKNEHDNITPGQLEKLKTLAKEYLRLSNDQLNRLILKSDLIEVNSDDETDNISKRKVR